MYRYDMEYLQLLGLVMGVPLVAISLLVTASIASKINLGSGQAINTFSDIASKFKKTA